MISNSLARIRRLSPILVVIAALALLLAACGDDDDDGGDTPTPGDSATAEPTPTEASGLPTGGTLNVAHRVDFQCLDPHTERVPIMNTGYETLVFVGSDGTPEPGLAESWESNADASVWTVNLRQGVTFHDGTDFNADAVLANLDRFFNVEGSRVASGLTPFFEPGDVTAVDDYSLEFALKQPYALFPILLGDNSNAGIISPAAIEDGTDLCQEVVGTGPFVLDSFELSSQITWSRNPDYWGVDADGTQLPYVDDMVWRIIPDASQRFTALQAGEVDIALGLDPTVRSQLESSSDLQALVADASFHVGLLFDINSEPFDNPDLVKAFKLAIDKEQVFETGFGGVGAVANQIFWPSSVYYDPSLESHPDNDFDATAAETALADAGYADGFDCGDFDIQMVIANVFPDSVRAGEIMQQMWSDVGITCEINPVDTPTIIDILNNSSFKLLLHRASAAADALQDLDRYYLPGGRYHYFWEPSDEAVVSSVQSALGETDESARISAAQDAHALILDQEDEFRWEVAQVGLLFGASSDLLNWQWRPGSGTEPFGLYALEQ
jgi:peptide/nickel transport system substrate-binding protein